MKKNRRNLFVSLLSLALVCVVAIGATLAYFTDKTEVAQNVFTTGHVNIELVDETNPTEGQIGGTYTDTGITYSKVMPGDNISKIVGVESVIDSEAAWVAIRVDVNNVDLPYSDREEAATSEIYNLVDAQVDHEMWSDRVFQPDGSVVYYYNTALDPFTENKAAMLFDHIDIPGVEWGNDYADMSFDIDVQAAAVQARNVSMEDFQAMTWDSLAELA